MSRFGIRYSLLCIAMLVGSAPFGRSEPLTPAEQARINQAILQGAIFLRNSQDSNGTWLPKDGNHPAGHAALGGLTLLECGLPSTHSVIQRAAAHVRDAVGEMKGTYELGLAILFFDRLSAANERGLEGAAERRLADKVIEGLALRLIAGQSTSGGWGYESPLLTPAEHQALLTALARPLVKSTSLPAALRKYAVLRDPARLMMTEDEKKKDAKTKRGTTPAPEPEDKTDNSNTHFAILALWVAQRHDVPVEKSFKLIVKRFRRSQNQDGGWGYKFGLSGGQPESAPMICTGLVGMAIDHGLSSQRDATGLSPTGKGMMFVSAAVGHPSLVNSYITVRSADRMLRSEEVAKEPVTRKAFEALAKHIGQPTGKTKDLPLGNLYFLWAIERMAMIYDLARIGDRDWYRWGAEMILANQKPDGHWEGGGYPGSDAPLDTSFALLFLRQANLAEDLTSLLRKDPGALDRAPPVVKSEPPAKPATPPTPPEDTEAKAVASVAKPKSTPPVDKVEKPTQPSVVRRAEPSSSPQPTEPPPAKESSNRALIWVGGGAGLMLVGGAVFFLVMGLRDRQVAPTESQRRVKKRSPGTSREDSRPRVRKRS